MRKNFSLLLILFITIILISSAKSIDCQDSEYIVTHDNGEQTCELCNDSFVSSDKKNCQSSCLEEIRPVQNKKTCLALDTDCKTSFSKYEKKCFDEGECKLVGKKFDGKPYYLCKDCPINRYFSSGELSCVKNCRNDEYTDKDKKECISIYMCELYQDYQNKACVPDCDGRKHIELKHLKSKFCGCLNNELLHLSSRSCVKSCLPPGPNSLKFNDLCLESFTQCPGVLSADGEECIEKCPMDQVANKFANYNLLICQCQHFYLKSTQKCVADCSTGTQVKYGKVCLSHADECHRFYNEIKNECYHYCDPNQTIIDVPGKSYRKCVCNNQSFLSINKISCQSQCDYSQITDITEKKCLENLHDCTGVISVDKQQCLPFCEPYQIAHQEKVENHTYTQCILCSGENKYFEEKDGVKKCVKECSDENALSLKLQACFPKENCNYITKDSLPICLDECEPSKISLCGEYSFCED